MGSLRLLRYVYWAYFSQPANERVFFRLLRQRICRSVVEIGVEDGRRAERLLRWLLLKEKTVRYTGIDCFEAGINCHPAASLKAVYRRLSRWTCHLRLIPGDPLTALQRTANELLHTDLLIINHVLGEDNAARAWIYLPRMLHDESLVLVRADALPAQHCDALKGVLAANGGSGSSYHRLTRDQVQQVADVIGYRTRRVA